MTFKRTISLMLALVFAITIISSIPCSANAEYVFSDIDSENSDSEQSVNYSFEENTISDIDFKTDNANIESEKEDKNELSASKFVSSKQTNRNNASYFEYYDNTLLTAQAFLEGMAICAPQYFKADVESFIEFFCSDEVQKYANQSADARSDYEKGGTEELEAKSIADSVSSALDSFLNSENAVDISAYQNALNVAFSHDSDAYDYSDDDINQDFSIITKNLTDTVEYDGLSLKVIKDDITQSKINIATSLILSQLSGHIRRYTIEIVEGNLNETSGITFNDGSHVYDEETNTYSVTYNTKLNLKADSYSAWYISFDTPSVSRSVQYQGSGTHFSINVIGNIKVYVYNSENKSKLSIFRRYSDTNALPTALVTYVTGEYELPVAPEIAMYSFSGYTIGEDSFSAGDIINVNQDTVVYANYVKNDSLDCTVSIDVEDQFCAAYNEKVYLNGNSDTYAWLELDKQTNTYKPFYIGKDVFFYVTESITLKKVNETEFNAAKYSLPAINIRQDGTYKTITDTVNKVHFNGQFVDDGKYAIAEYGIVLGKANENGSINSSDVLLENIGASEQYTIVRFKSTKNVGANQFTIGVKNLSGNVIYKGYITYKLSAQKYVTVYSDAISETL